MSLIIDEIIVLILCVGGIVFTYWYFLNKKENNFTAQNGEVKILVEGGYSPDSISIPVNKPTKIIFLRKDKSSCLEEVVLDNFKIKKYLPLGEETIVEVHPTEKGEYRFTCGMGMFHGKLKVV